MTDSGSSPAPDRPRPDPLQVAADMLAQDTGDAQTSPSAPESVNGHADGSSRDRRAAARAARQEAAEKRRRERAEAKQRRASRARRGGHSDDAEPPAEIATPSVELTLAEKLEAAREAASTPPDRLEADLDETRELDMSEIRDAVESEPQPDPEPEGGPVDVMEPAEPGPVDDAPREQPAQRSWPAAQFVSSSAPATAGQVAAEAEARTDLDSEPETVADVEAETPEHTDEPVEAGAVGEPEMTQSEAQLVTEIEPEPLSSAEPELVTEVEPEPQPVGQAEPVAPGSSSTFAEKLAAASAAAQQRVAAARAEAARLMEEAARACRGHGPARG